MSELITVIVPVYKVEKYINRCIDSILRQTYTNLEIILVNDGSPDRSGAIGDEYARLDKRVKVIHKENGGLSDARNIGIDNANGEYISFVDSDDWVHEEYIERLYLLLKKTNSEIAVCNFIKTSTENVQLDNSKEEIYEYSNIEALEQFFGIFYVQMVIACGKLYRIELFDNIRFPFGRIHEDEFITYKLIYKADKIALTTLPLFYYWQREDSIMGIGFNIKHRLDALDAFEERANFFREMGLEELSSLTYRSVFGRYLTIIISINEFNDVISEKEFKENFKELRNSLRKSKQKFSFKMFYELFYIAPKAMNMILSVYRKSDKYLKN